MHQVPDPVEEVANNLCMPEQEMVAANWNVSGEHPLEGSCQLLADDSGRMTQYYQQNCRCYNARPVHCCSTTPLAGSDCNS